MIAITLSIVFGLGWGIGLPATQALHTTAVRDTFSVLFILLTAFQGLLIFIMRCARSTEVLKHWKKCFSSVTGKQYEDITSSILGKAHLHVHHAQLSASGPTHSTILSKGKETLEMTSKKPRATTASTSDEFSFQFFDDDDGMSTLKRNVAKSGMLSGLSTLQRIPKSLPETIGEKERAAELADAEISEEEEASTTFKLPTHQLLSDTVETVEQLSQGGDKDYEFEENVCFSLPTVPHSTSNPSLHSTASETDAQVTSFNNPLFAKKD